MKLTAFLLMISTLGVLANKSYSQTKAISLTMEKVTIKDVLSRIESLSEYYFMYSEKFIDVTKQISINVENKKIEDVLNLLFAGTDVRFERNDRLIIISRSDAFNASSEQQQKSISGKVIDSSGSPLPGVSVVVKGTTQGIITDTNGNYSLAKVPDDATLVFSFVGMKMQEISTTGKSSIDVKMEEDAIGIEEVVAVGYGTVRKKDLIGAVSSVGNETLEKIPVTSVAQAIQGQMAGVQVTKTEGSPDAEILIRVRGGGSLTQDNSPLYIVDGFPVTSISNIAPTDIASINVLKDASSTAIYGARGANGVILITTKGGFEGKGKISYNTYYGIKELTKKFEVLDPYEYVLWQYEAFGNVVDNQRRFGVFGDIGLYKQMDGINWQEEVFGETGSSFYNNIAFTGGSKTSKYNISITRNDEKEIMLGSGYDRTNVMANISHKVNNWFTIDLNTLWSDYHLKGNVVSERSVTGRVNSAIVFRPTEGLSDYVDTDLTSPDLYEAASLYTMNPVRQILDDYRRRENMTFNINGAATINFSPSLFYRFSYGTQFDKSQADVFYGLNTYQAQLDGLPRASIDKVDNMNYRVSNTLTYNKKDFIVEGHNLTLLAGQEFVSFQAKSLSTSARYFPKYIDAKSAISMMQLGTALPVTTAISPDNNLLSCFGRLNYDYKGKYLVSATMRADQSNKFATGSQWGCFPSLGLGWRISDEKFMAFTKDWLSDLKLRGSYGTAGNNRISDNAWRKIFSVSTSNLGIGDIQAPFLIGGSILSNRKLKWETTVTRNAGADFAFFKQRMRGTVEVYKNVTKDLLIQASIPPATGYSTQWQNIGQTSNRGIEITLEGNIIEKKDFRLFASFNIGFNKNHIDKLGEAKRWEEQTNWGASSGALNDYIVEEGGEVGVMYGYVTDGNGMYSFDDFDVALNSATGKYTYTIRPKVASDQGILNPSWFGPGSLKLKDMNGDYVVNEADRVPIGNANPKHTGGFNLTAQFKGFDLSAYLNWSYGNDIYNANKLAWSSRLQGFPYRNLLNTMSSDKRFLTIDKETGSGVTDPIQLSEMNKDATIWSPMHASAKLHSWAVEDGSFLRLNTLTIGYSLPKNILTKMRMSQLRIYATTYNLWVWTGYSGYDPEVSTIRSTPLTPGCDWNSYPRSRTINIGLNAEF